jgi:RND family efflux transporter MFP subunit
MAKLRRKVVLPVIIGLVVAVYAAYRIANAVAAKHKPLEAAGTLEAVEVDIGSLLAGRIVAVNYDEGDRVQAGAVVATLDAAELDATEAAAAAAAGAAARRVDAARANLAAAEDSFKRVHAALARGGITQAEYERAKAGRDGAAAELASAAAAAAQARAARAQVEARRKEVDLVAPLSGVVLSRNLEPGEVLAPGAAVLTVADLSRLEVYVYIPEGKIGGVKTGDAVEIAVDSFPGERFAGKIKSVGAATEFTPRNVESKEDRMTLVFKVTVTVPNPESKLKPGMPADVVFPGTTAAGKARGR